MWYTMKEMFLIYIPAEWETINTQDGFKILAKGDIDERRGFVGVTDPIDKAQMIEDTYYFYFKGGLVFRCAPKTRGVSAETIEYFDHLKEKDGSVHLCDPGLVLLEKGDIYTV